MSTVQTEDVPVVVKPEGELDEATAADLRRELNKLVAGGRREIIMDLAQVRSIDAVGLTLLCAAHNSLTREQGALSIINASPELETLLARIGLSRHVSTSTAE